MHNVVRGPNMWFMPSTTRPTHVKAIVGARLRVMRAVLGLNQKTFAAAINISPQAFNNWESGRDLVDPLLIARAALRFGFTTDWIYTGRLSLLPDHLAEELSRRRPDLVLGGDPLAAPAADWDALRSPTREAG